jgi:hypothetical protein
MMIKLKIYATGNETIRGENNISYYIFEKMMEQFVPRILERR